MRKILLSFFIIVIFSTLFISPLWALSDQAQQSVSMQVDEINHLNLSGSPGTLTISAPAAAGMVPPSATNNNTYLYYTSTVSTGLTRKVTVALSLGDQVPVGTSLRLQAESVPAQCGIGQVPITLTTSSQEIVTDIGSCYTGSSGARLKYDLVVDNVNALDAGDDRMVIIHFTLTDN